MPQELFLPIAGIGGDNTQPPLRVGRRVDELRGWGEGGVHGYYAAGYGGGDFAGGFDAFHHHQDLVFFNGAADGGELYVDYFAQLLLAVMGNSDFDTGVVGVGGSGWGWGWGRWGYPLVGWGVQELPLGRGGGVG